MIDPHSRKAARHALLLGVLGVAIFGLTLPATRLAVAELDPLFVTAGRSLLAAALASLTLLWARPPAPLRREWPRLAAFAAFHHRVSPADGDRHAIRPGLPWGGGAGRAAAAHRHGRRVGGG